MTAYLPSGQTIDPADLHPGKPVVYHAVRLINSGTPATYVGPYEGLPGRHLIDCGPTGYDAPHDRDLRIVDSWQMDEPSQ